MWIQLLVKTDAIVMSYSSVFFSELIQQHFYKLKSVVLWLLLLLPTYFLMLLPSVTLLSDLKTFLGIYFSAVTVMETEWPLADNVLLEAFFLYLQSASHWAILCTSWMIQKSQQHNPEQHQSVCLLIKLFQLSCFLTGLYLFKSFEATYWDSFVGIPTCILSGAIMAFSWRRTSARWQGKRGAIVAGWWTKHKSSGVSQISTKTP